MPISRKAFQFFSSSSSSLPSSSSSPNSYLHDNTVNADNSCNNQAQHQKRRLTRQRKLRHVTADELGLRFTDIDRSFSTPCSPDTGTPTEHWSSSAVPKPLPSPDLFVNRKSKTSGSSPAGPTQLTSPGEGFASSFGR